MEAGEADWKERVSRAFQPMSRAGVVGCPRPMRSIGALTRSGQEIPCGREESIPGSWRGPASPRSSEKPASEEQDWDK